MNIGTKEKMEIKLARVIHDIIAEFCEDYNVTIKSVKYTLSISETDSQVSEYSMETDMQ